MVFMYFPYMSVLYFWLVVKWEKSVFNSLVMAWKSVSLCCAWSGQCRVKCSAVSRPCPHWQFG